MLRASLEALYALVQAAWPTGALTLHPDDRSPFEAALKTAAASNQVVVRYYQPQLLRAGALAEFLCHVDICAPKVERASADAEKLLDLVTRTARHPGALTPRAVHLAETSYARYSVSFTLFIDSSAVPTPDESPES